MARLRHARILVWLVVLLGIAGISPPAHAGGTSSSTPAWSSSTRGGNYRSSTVTPRGGAGRPLRPLTSSTSSASEPRAAYAGSTKPTTSSSGSGGRLDSHEAAGGHLLAQHVAVSPAAMSARLASQPALAETSTFTDRREAERAVGAVLKQRSSEIASWVRNGAHGSKGFSGRFSCGSVMARGSKDAVPGSSARIVLQGDGRGKYFILTGYPQR